MKCIKNYEKDFGWKLPSKVMILNLSPLQSKALFTFEFIGLGRVLSNLEIPFQALQSNDDTSLRLGAKKEGKFCTDGAHFPICTFICSQPWWEH